MAHIGNGAGKKVGQALSRTHVKRQAESLSYLSFFLAELMTPVGQAFLDCQKELFHYSESRLGGSRIESYKGSEALG
jgi:hypothetical protein